jgi:hypothetical protein
MGMPIELAFTGRLGSQMCRHTKKGDRFLMLSIAVNSNDGTEWVHVSVLKPMLEELADELIKDERIYLRGQAAPQSMGERGRGANLAVNASRVLMLDRIGASRAHAPSLLSAGRR